MEATFTPDLLLTMSGPPTLRNANLCEHKWLCSPLTLLLNNRGGDLVALPDAPHPSLNQTLIIVIDNL